MTTAEVNPKTKLFKKLNALRGKLVTLDWTPDGQMKLGLVPTRYISINQAKAKIAPLFPEFGLEFSVNMSKPELAEPGTRTWYVEIEVSIIDVDTCESIEYTFWGYGAGDKGVAIATSYALKTMLSSVFCFADGMDPEKDTITSAAPATFIRTEREKEEAMSKVVSNSVKRDPVKTEPKPEPKAEPKAEPVPAKPVADKPATKEEPKAVAPADDKPMSPMQGKAIAKILQELENQVGTGALTADVLDAKRAEANSLKTATEARKFITENRVL